jgi:hypothetical protein
MVFLLLAGSFPAKKCDSGSLAWAAGEALEGPCNSNALERAEKRQTLLVPKDAQVTMAFSLTRAPDTMTRNKKLRLGDSRKYKGAGSHCVHPWRPQSSGPCPGGRETSFA